MTIRQMLHLSVATNGDSARWDDFVSKHPDATFFHRFIWGSILQDGSIGDRLYFILEDNRDVLAIMPAFLLRNPINNLRCLPISDYGSPLVSDNYDSGKIFLRLLNQVRYESLRHLCLYFSFRLPSFSALRNARISGYKCRLTNFSTRLSISGKNEDDIWKQISKKRRNSIKKALRSDLEIRNGTTENDFQHYYRMHTACLGRGRGDLLLNYRIFGSIRDKLVAGRDYVMMLAYHQGVPIAGTISFVFMDKVYLWNNVSYKEFWNLNPNDLLYWEVMRYACERGYKVVDLGASPMSKKGGTSFFKGQFGGDLIGLLDYYYSPIPFFLRSVSIISKMRSRFQNE